VVLGWVVFRADTLSYALHYLARMFVYQSGPMPDTLLAVWTNHRVAVLVLGLAIVLFPASLVTGRLIERRDTAWAIPVRWAVLGLLLPYATVLVAAGTFSPFLYFQF
jgi:alginate O-acetyltransferase complex protein AlgI